MKKAAGKIGKNVGGALYVHRSACALIPPQLALRVSRADGLVGDLPWSVAKIDLRNEQSLSLLDYEAFEIAAFPALLASHSIDLDAGTVRTRSYGAENPPILHRKELLLARDHPDRGKYARLTELLVKHGLFQHMTRRGRRKPWQAALDAAGIVVANHDLLLVTPGESAATTVDRHKTAIARDGLSAPVAALQAAGFLSGKMSFLDYGCGRGDDVTALTALGVESAGWDPYYAPSPDSLRLHDLVNLGFVLNVIEKPGERAETLRRAFALSKRCLSIAVMLTGKGDISGQRVFGDGYLTSRGTFQKYYSQADIRDYISETLNLTPIAAGQGVFLVFRDEALEQVYLERRQAGLAGPTTKPRRAPQAFKDDASAEIQQELLQQVTDLLLELGRAPHRNELPGPLDSALSARNLSLSSIINWASSELSHAEINQAAEYRRCQVRRFFALQAFSGRPSYRDLDPRLRHDIRAFFGNLRNAEEEGRELLFSAGDMAALTKEARGLHERKVGHLFGDEYQFHFRDVERLSERFKTYVGIAQALAGSFEGATVLRAHLGFRMLTTLCYNDFETSPLPRLSTRTKIDLKTGQVASFDHLADKRVSVLLCKSRYMSETDPKRPEQAKFDEAITKLFPNHEGRPDFATLARGLLAAGIRLPH